MDRALLLIALNVGQVTYVVNGEFEAMFLFYLIVELCTVTDCLNCNPDKDECEECVAGKWDQLVDETNVNCLGKLLMLV